MLQTFTLMFREGLEALLVVAVSVAYLRKAGRPELVRVTYVAVAASALVSIAAGWLFGRASNRPLWEGLLALVAAATIAPLTVQVLRSGRRLPGRIQDGLARRLARPSAPLAVFFFVLFMVSREGMEMSLLFSVLSAGVDRLPLLAGATLGLAASAGLALAVSRHGHRVPVGRLLQVTGVFLLVFLVQLLIVGVHELAEAGVLPHAAMLHAVTEAYGPEGSIGAWISYALLMVPLGWLLGSFVWDRAFRRSGSPSFSTPRRH